MSNAHENQVTLSTVKSATAVGNGVANDTAALQARLTLGGRVVFPAGTYLISAALTVPSNTDIVLEAGAVVTTATADISHFNAANASRVTVSGPGKIKSTATGTAAYVAGVNLTGATDCEVRGVEFEGMQWAAVYMKNATNCRALHNYVHDHLGDINGQAAFTVSGSAYACTVEGNRTKNTGWFGVGVIDEDATVGVVPKGTRVLFNDIDGTNAYGIAVYELSAEDSDTLVHGNRIRNVTGVNPSSGAGGAGVYVQNSGGVRVTSNLIRNVCTASAVASLTPAGVGVNNIGAALVPPVIVGNTIADVGFTEAGVANAASILLAGVNVSSSASGAVVNDNVIKQATALTTPSFVGVYCNATSNFMAAGNKATLATTGGGGTGLFVYANGLNLTNIVLTGNQVVGGTNAYVQVADSGGFTTTGLTLTGGSLRGGGTSCRGIQISNTGGYSVTGVQVDATAEALYLNASTSGRIAGNRFSTTGATSILTGGACTGSLLDKSNLVGTVGTINNAGTGLALEWRTNAVPASGTWAVGDRTEQSVPVVGQPKGWRCTVAGTPGTWVAEGNL